MRYESLRSEKPASHYRSQLCTEVAERFYSCLSPQTRQDKTGIREGIHEAMMLSARILVELPPTARRQEQFQAACLRGASKAKA